MLGMIVNFLVDNAYFGCEGLEVRLSQILKERIHDGLFILMNTLLQIQELLCSPSYGQGCSTGKKGTHLCKAQLDFVHALSPFAPSIAPKARLCQNEPSRKRL